MGIEWMWAHRALPHLHSAIHISGNHKEVDDRGDFEVGQRHFGQVAPIHVGSHVLESLQGFRVQHGLRAGRLLKKSAQVMRHSRRVSQCHKWDAFFLLDAYVCPPIFCNDVLPAFALRRICPARNYSLLESRNPNPENCPQ